MSGLITIGRRSRLKNVIVTNNPMVAEKHDHVLYLNGSVEEILIKVRVLVYQGYDLISHPLPGSLRMMFSPFRSIILGRNLQKVDSLSAQIIEESIIKFSRHKDFRKLDNLNKGNYQKLDLLLLKTAIQEQAAMW